MTDEAENPLTLLQEILEHPDTGFVPVPMELLSTKEAAARRGLSERTMRRRAEKLGIGIMIGKTWYLAARGLDALHVNDTGTLADVRHDVQLISGLSGCPISLSTPSEGQIMPIAWTQESSMQFSIRPSQRFPETLRLKLPEGMSAALQFAARRRVQSTSDWVRQALLERLHREGLVLTDTGVTCNTEEV